jgi:hypothetical protein
MVIYRRSSNFVFLEYELVELLFTNPQLANFVALILDGRQVLT